MSRVVFAILLSSLLCLLLSLNPHNVPSSSATPLSFDRQSFILPGGVVDKSSPTLADLTNDGIPEVLVGTTAYNGTNGQNNQDMVLVALRGNGTTLWSRSVGAPINSSPAVADLDGDGNVEVVVSVGGDPANVRHNGGIIAFDRNGNQIWRFNTQDYSPVDGFTDGVYSSPTVCDVDGDGNMEIAFGGWDKRIYLLDHLGRSLWSNIPNGFPGPGYYNADSIWSTAACADLNGDGSKEIVIGADITGGGILPDGTHTSNGGFLYVFDKDGNVLVRRYLLETIYSSPAVGDLDGNGQLEIVVGTGWYWWNISGRRDDSFAYVFDTSNLFGTLPYADPNKLPNYPGWPQETQYPGFSSPALADLDGDGDLEVVIGSGDPFITNDDIPGAGAVYAWHHTGQRVNGWPVFPRNVGNDDTTVFSSPVVADVDADGVVEVLFSMIWDVHVYNANGSFQERLSTTWTTWASPAVGDTDGDGKVDVWVASGKDDGDKSKGHMWHFEQSASGIGPQPWPQFHRDARNSGKMPVTAHLAASDAVGFYQSGGNGTLTVSVTLRNAGENRISWRVSAEPDRVDVVPSSGLIAGADTEQLSLIVDTRGLTQGTYQLGSITITGTDQETGEDIIPLGIPVTLVVGNVSTLYLPLAQR